MTLFKRTLATLSKTPFVKPSLTSFPSKTVPASLRFNSGEEFKATSFGSNITPITSGEVVFTTSVVGYPESMTDPSYHGQILVFTQPIIGNYGVPPSTRDSFGLLKHFESEKIQVSGIIGMLHCFYRLTYFQVNDYAAKYSHWNAIESLGNWCSRSGVPALSGVDTRAVVTLLRDFGSKSGHISIGEAAIAQPMPDFNNDSTNWIDNVSSRKIKVYNPSGSLKIALIDCGAKQNIIRCLAQRGASVTVFPHNYDFSPSLQDFDGVFISNGPGDPLAAQDTISIVKKIVEKSSNMSVPIPVFGICVCYFLKAVIHFLDGTSSAWISCWIQFL
jgi:carbamoyl-phosphate synthase small subunit